MQLSIKNRLMKLELKQPQNNFCFPLEYFYGHDVPVEPLIPNQSLSDFYNSQIKEPNGKHS